MEEESVQNVWKGSLHDLLNEENENDFEDQVGEGPTEHIYIKEIPEKSLVRKIRKTLPYIC